MVMKDLESLNEEERKALRGSKFAPLPSSSLPSRSQPRLAHPGGPLTTNKAAALARFLERKLQDPNGLESINPDLLELAVKNAKQSVFASSTSSSARLIRHVDSFGDPDDSSAEVEISKKKHKEKKKNKKRGKGKKKRKQKMVEDTECSMKSRKKLKL